MALKSHTTERIVLAPDGRRVAVLEVIRSAQKRLILSLFRCDDRRVLEALADARRRGVLVEVLLTRRGKGRSELKLLRMLLERLGVRLRLYPDRFVTYHAKYVVADDGPALVGSLNFTHKCFKKTSDFLLMTDDLAVVSGLTALFEADSRAPLAGLSSELSPRLIIGPELARQQIAGLIEQAERSICVSDPNLQDPGMRAILRTKAAAGVSVAALCNRRVGGLRSHGKLLVVDDTVAAIGSMALSTSNLDARRELGIIVRDRRAIAQLLEFFHQAALQEPAGLSSPEFPRLQPVMNSL